MADRQDNQHDALPDLWQAWRKSEIARCDAVTAHGDAEEQHGSSSAEAKRAEDDLDRVYAEQALADARVGLAVPRTLAGAVAQAQWLTHWAAQEGSAELVIVGLALTRNLEELATLDHDPLTEELVANDRLGEDIEDQRREWQAMLESER